jgi:hypothetical protein
VTESDIISEHHHHSLSWNYNLLSASKILLTDAMVISSSLSLSISVVTDDNLNCLIPVLTERIC